MNALAVFFGRWPADGVRHTNQCRGVEPERYSRRAHARRDNRRGIRADWFRRVDRAAVFNTRNWTPRRREVQSQREVLEMRKFKRIKGSLGRWTARLGYAFGVLTIALPARAFAATAGGVLPWDQPLNTLQNGLQGTGAHAIVTAAIIGTGITWSVSEHGTGVRKMSAVAFGGPPAPGATQLMATLFPLRAAVF